MRVIRKDELNGSSRRIQNDNYTTTRFLLASDQAGVSLTDIVLMPGIREAYGYAALTESAYCLEGEATVTEAAGKREAITPGTMWVAEPGETFRFVAIRPTRLICVFTPPLEGDETGFAADMTVGT